VVQLRLPQLVALPTNPLKLPPPVVQPKLLLPVVRPTSLLRLPQLVALPRSLLRLPLPAALPKLLLPVVLLTSRKKSPLPVALPVALATSNRFFPIKTVPGGKILAGNLAYYSVLPIYDRNKKQ